MEKEIIETKEIIEEINYTISTIEYRRKLMIKISIIFFCSLLILISRLFNKYSAFDIVMSSLLFQVLIIAIVFTSIMVIIYFQYSKNNVNEEPTNKIYKRLLSIFDLAAVVPIFMAIVSIMNSFLV